MKQTTTNIVLSLLQNYAVRMRCIYDISKKMYIIFPHLIFYYICIRLISCKAEERESIKGIAYGLEITNVRL